MTTFELENTLRRTMRTRRIILGVTAAALFVLFAVCLSLFESTKEVIRNPIIIDGIQVHPGFETVRQNDAYLTPILLGLIGTLFAGSFLLTDLLFIRFRTITKDQQDVTVYCGFLYNIVYVNGVEAGRAEPFTFTNVVEVWLPDKTRVTVSFSRTIWYLAHVSFSDDTASLEI